MMMMPFAFSARTLRPLSQFALVAVLMLVTLGCAKKTPEEMLEEAIGLLQTHDVFGAELKFQEIIEKHPESEVAPRAQMGLAYCYEQDKRFEEARAAYDKVIEMVGGVQTPLGFEGFRSRIMTYMDPAARNPAQALSDVLATSATLSTASDEVKYAYKQMLADLYHLNENDDQALIVLNDLSRQPPSDSRHFSVMERIEQIYRSRKQPELAIQAYEDYIKAFPDSQLNRAMRFKMAQLEKERGNEAAAEDLLEGIESELIDQEAKAIGGDEKSSKLMELAALQQARGDLASARAALKRCIDEFPMSRSRPDAMFMLAKLEHDNGNVPEAIALLTKISQDFPNTQPAAMALNSIREIQMAAAATTATLSATMSSSATLMSSDTQPITTGTLTTDTLTSPTP